MIGVRKDSGVIRLLMAAALVLFVAACSGDSGVKQSVHDAALEQVEDLEGTVVELTGSLDELREQLAALQESGTDADQETIDELMERIAELEQEAKDAEAAEKRASVLALYKGLDPRINPVAPVAGGVADPTALTPPLARFDVVHDSATDTENVTLRVTSGKATKVTPGTTGTGPMNNKLADAAGMLSDSHGPWSSTMVSAKATTGDKDTDTVVVLTDIAPDKSVEFEKVFTLNANNVLPATDPDAAVDNDSIVSKYVSAAGFPTEVGVTVHGENTSDVDETIKYLGTYAGAPGIYTCTEDGSTNSCESQGTNDGVQLSGGWNFDPDGGAMAQQADTEYSYFGWWWRVSADGDYDVDVFHGNQDGTPVTDTVFNALTGTASYVGPAAGKYAISPQLPGTEVMGGHWDATASLTVDFEEGTNAEINGSVHDFMQDGDALPFEVTFPAAEVTISATAVDFSGTNVVWLIDEEKSSSMGTWSGDFHNQGKDEVPITVTGEFASTYNHEVGRIEGAFGATKQ